LSGGRGGRIKENADKRIWLALALRSIAVDGQDCRPPKLPSFRLIQKDTDRNTEESRQPEGGRLADPKSAGKDVA
jgi:hypothetical protein